MRLAKSFAADGVLAVAMAMFGMAGTAAADRFNDADQLSDPRGLVLAGAAGLLLILRRRKPIITLAAVTGLTSAYLIMQFPYGPILLSFFVAVYTVACYLPLPRSVPASLAALAVLAIHVFVHKDALPGLPGLIPAAGWAVVPFAIGYTVGLYRQSEARARAEVVRQRVSDERLRVAQEVHDVVGHGLAAIKMQADIALHVLAKKPEQAEAALAAISRSSTEALDELRATLTVVRRSPAVGLERLDELRQRMADAGLQVEVDTAGSRRDLPAAIDLAGYRIIQESLTNVLRHSQEKVATVRIAYTNDAVTVTVSNPIARKPSVSNGFGIPGMHERVIALGGSFSAGPTADGRFVVRAHLPIGAGQ